MDNEDSKAIVYSQPCYLLKLRDDAIKLKQYHNSLMKIKLIPDDAIREQEERLNVKLFTVINKETISEVIEGYKPFGLTGINAVENSKYYSELIIKEILTNKIRNEIIFSKINWHISNIIFRFVTPNHKNQNL